MRRLAAGLVVTLGILLGPRLACAQRTPAADSLLDRMTGHWVLRGTIDGRATTHDVVAEWVLGREYVRLHEVARERSPTGAPAYEAIVYIGVPMHLLIKSLLPSPAAGGALNTTTSPCLGPRRR